MEAVNASDSDARLIYKVPSTRTNISPKKSNSFFELRETQYLCLHLAIEGSHAGGVYVAVGTAV